MKFVLLLLLAVPAFAQVDLPDRGTIADLKGKKSVYVVADTEHRKQIEKVLKKSFTLVSKASEADFFLEYKVTERLEVRTLNVPIDTGQLDAYLYKDKTRVVAWSDSANDGGFSGPAYTQLAKRFLKEWKKVQ